jgi:hypothetical protein
VKAYLTSKGFAVTKSTEVQDKFEDIDLFLEGIPASIKAEHSGIRYHNVYFELGQQLSTHEDCAYTKSIIGTKNRLSPSDCSDLLDSPSWEHSWYYTGKADIYLIYQGDKLLVYKKEDIVRYVEDRGWLRICTLNNYRKSYLGGTYRYCNSMCGFIDIDAVKHLTYTLLLEPSI